MTFLLDARQSQNQICQSTVRDKCKKKEQGLGKIDQAFFFYWKWNYALSNFWECLRIIMMPDFPEEYEIVVTPARTLHRTQNLLIGTSITIYAFADPDGSRRQSMTRLSLKV